MAALAVGSRRGALLGARLPFRGIFLVLCPGLRCVPGGPHCLQPASSSGLLVGHTLQLSINDPSGLVIAAGAVLGFIPAITYLSVLRWRGR